MGAKSQLRTWLVQQFPDTHTYVEPFTGSAKVLLWKPRRARVEIINDFDADLASFLRYVQSDPHRLVQVINALPTHEAVVLGMRTMLAKRELKGVERAAGFYITSQSAFNTKGDYSSYKSSPHVLMDLSIDLSKVLKVHDRLNTGKKVDIRSTGYERIIKACNKDLPSSRYPPGGVFFYLDPPYWATAGYKTLQGESSFGWRDQVNLANLCYEIHLMGNKFMQTNSYHEDLLKLYGGFKDSMGRPMFYLQDVNVRYTVAGSREEGELDKELVISNYPINSAQRQMGLL